MVLTKVPARIVATEDNQAVKIAVTAARNRAVSILLSLWSAGVVAIYVVMVISLITSGVALLWLLLPTVFAGAMVRYAVSLLRWNNRGEESITISEGRVTYERRFHPTGTRERVFDGKPEAFALWRPYQRKHVQLDYEFWGVGPWSVGLLASGKRVELLSRLTKLEVRCVGEMLRRAGCDVHGLEEVG